jgi:hypothetical protein
MDESVDLGRRDRFAHWPRAMRMSCRSSTSTSPHAGSTWFLFRADWGAVLWRVYQKMNDNRLLAVAAGVVFYGLPASAVAAASSSRSSARRRAADDSRQ